MGVHSLKDETLEIEVVNTLERVNKESLSSFANNDACYSYSWLKTVEDSKASFEVEPRYFLVHDKRNLVGFMPAYIYQNCSYFNVENKNPIIKKTVSALRGFGINVDRGKALLCEPPASGYSRLLTKQDCNLQEVFKALSSKVDEVCREEKLFLSTFSRVLEHDKLNDSLQNSGYGYVNVKKTRPFELDVTWSSFEDYVSNLPYEYRKDVRREIKKFLETGITITLEEDFNKYSQTLANLYSNLHSKYNGFDKESPFQASFFSSLYKHAKDSTKIFLAIKNSDIIGFSMVLLHQKTFDVVIVGFNYSAMTKTDFVYFNLAYYEPIKMAIRGNIEKMYFRWGSEKAKLHRNLQQQNTYTYSKIHNRVLKSMAKYLSPYWR